MVKTRILISGAGIAGSTLASWLMRGGSTPALAKRAQYFRMEGYILDFWGIGLVVAERMGLVPSLRQRGYVFDRLRYVAEDGGTRAELSADAVRRALGDCFLSIRPGDMARTIYDLIEGKVETLVFPTCAVHNPQ